MVTEVIQVHLGPLGLEDRQVQLDQKERQVLQGQLAQVVPQALQDQQVLLVHLVIVVNRVLQDLLEPQEQQGLLDQPGTEETQGHLVPRDHKEPQEIEVMLELQEVLASLEILDHLVTLVRLDLRDLKALLDLVG